MPTSRRRFLQQLTATGALLTVPSWARAALPTMPVRMRGQVRAEGTGLAGVGVTDGLSVVETQADGTFELITTDRRPFVYLSLPAGYAIPQNATGTARCYQPIQPDAQGKATATFDLTSLDGDDANHAFLVLADPQTQTTYETELLHAQTVPDVQDLLATRPDGEPIFGVACGDIMFDDLSLYPEYER
ncbi:MAG: twin-arginine translocation signal domain-containing protein, partial [Bacteroidetes bacterium]|nr:twin-arginine translocation signal domain-containing protein [Bacteroidota bacterium]